MAERIDSFGTYLGTVQKLEQDKKRIEISNLVFLVWEHCVNMDDAYTRVTGECPSEVVLDLRAGTWQYNSSDKSDPNNGKVYRIGSREHRDVAYSGWRFGPIGVYDRTQIEHLDNMVCVAEDGRTNLMRPRPFPPNSVD